MTANKLNISAYGIFSLLMVSSFFFSSASGPQNPKGQALYEQHCKTCHKSEGRFKLRKSKLNDEEVIQFIKKGKGRMPSFEPVLKQEELQAVKDYVIGLRK